MARPVDGRYVVADKAIPSLGAAIGYAQTLASKLREPGRVFVREIGREGPVVVVVRDERGVVTTGRQT